MVNFTFIDPGQFKHGVQTINLNDVIKSYASSLDNIVGYCVAVLLGVYILKNIVFPIGINAYSGWFSEKAFNKLKDHILSFFDTISLFSVLWLAYMFLTQKGINHAWKLYLIALGLIVALALVYQATLWQKVRILKNAN